MQIRIRRLAAHVALPRYQSRHAAGFDLAAREPVVVEPGAVVLVPTGLVIEVPEHHALLIVARSSLPIKKRLMVANGVGVVDADYRGPTDEVKVELYNFSGEPATIAEGERIAQGLIVPVVRASWLEVNEASAPERGGFGSTGGYVTPTMPSISSE
ncbi:MAG: dUTP diphosphatase [Vicinamibacterales bacterium]